MKPIQQLITDHIDIWTAAEAEKKTGSGRTSGSSCNVYGVKKLRELILELAVRGKLVPQNPNDEPASDLLKRIHPKKTKLTANGKINEEKLLAPITDEEKPFLLPDGWTWVKLDDIGSTFIGLTYSPKDVSSIGTPVLRSSNIQNGKIDLHDLVRVNVPIKENLFVDEGDLLICVRNGSKSLVGKTAMIKNLKERMVFGAFMAIYKSKLNFYIEVFLNSPVFRNLLEGVATTTINQITQNNLKNTLIPIPPIAEQHRIVAKVDELMALCDHLEVQHNNAAEAHEKLVGHLLGILTQSQNSEDFSENWQRIAAHFDIIFTTESSIYALEQTILKLAVMGKLVPQDPNDEPASELVNRIAARKNKLAREKKIKCDDAITPITEDEKSFELPNNWTWVRVCQVFDVTSGASFNLSAEKKMGKYIYLKVGDMNIPENKSTIKTSSRFVDPAENELKGIIPANSIIFPKRGGAIATNKKRLVTSKIFVDLNIMAITVPQEISLNYTFQWLSGIDLAKLNTGTSVPQINHKDIDPLIFPLPPRAEQQRITAKVNELMAQCDQMKSRLSEAAKLQIKIADAIVNQAMS